ncbi:hypothetical protein COB55_00345 [Candidatus Wolfebacteria bacterium]|nr:MAG: hypothetical protein COB55_00345 [Candidatus Wolfebacteria bacterium]
MRMHSGFTVLLHQQESNRVPAKLVEDHGTSGGRGSEIFMSLKDEMNIHESGRFLRPTTKKPPPPEWFFVFYN